MTNEIIFFGTNQRDAFNSFANNLINVYNNLSDNHKLSAYGTDFYKLQSSGLISLIDKVNTLIFHRGDPLSVPVFLKRVANGKIVGLGKPAGDKNATLDETFLGFGHFRVDGKVIKLNDLELKALNVYLRNMTFTNATTSFKYKDLVISSKLIKSGVQFPNQKEDKGLHNQFKISVVNKEGTAINFDFYGSTNDYKNGVTEIKNDELLNAFDCFISDSMAGEQEFEDFCSEFGYDSDSRTAERIHKECIKSLSKAKLIIEQDIYDFANELREAIEN